MIQGLIGKKIGMTQLFDDDGRVHPVTVIQAGPCVVVQKKSNAGDPRQKVQIGLVEERKIKSVNRPMKGHFDKAGVPPTRILREVLTDDEAVSIGDTVKVDIFDEKESVSVVGTTKGKGFQGVVKRWNFAGGRATHGSMFHRRPGSTGMCAYPGEVHKGKKMPGRMGGNRKTVKGLRIVRVDAVNNLILVHGAVPGYNGNYVMVLKDSFKRR
ncbi:MAG: 50S ribosomal protein L3 [Acidobacteriota bacterium]|jgi:large subunit ribosomal protein L3|nr:50S ribosomal protein L3 [Acidobacteriota bacterium]